MLRLRRRVFTTAALPASLDSSSMRSNGFLRIQQPTSLQNLRRISACQHITRSFTSVAEHPVAVAHQMTDDCREKVVALLKARCNALYDDNEAYVAPAESLSLWLRDVQTLQRQYEPSQLEEEIVRAYESGVAIASKQQQFDLATLLVQQMQQLGLQPSERTRQYLIRNVALQLVGGPRHTSLQDLRYLMESVNENIREREIMDIVQREERPVQLKTNKEFALFHKQLIAGIEAQLNEYEHSLKPQGAEQRTLQKSIVPYNEALRVYADNGVTFSRMLELMVSRDLMVNIETYEALLLGARWNEIPATLTQLLESKLVDELATASDDIASGHVCTLWINAMRAVIYSSSERFNSLSASVYKRDVDQLRKVFVFVNKQLSRAFPTLKFATATQYDEVYTIRVKAAAACGLSSFVKNILDEYIECAPSNAEVDKPILCKDPFLSALEIYPWSLMDVLMLSRENALTRAENRDVATSPRVFEMQQMYELVMQKLNLAQKTIADIKRVINARSTLDEDELRLLLAQKNRANQVIEQESTRATTLERRLDNARILKANQLLIKEYLTQADETVGYVLSRLVNAGFGAETDLDVAVKLMEQYMKCARRLDRRLTQRQKHVSSHMMQRVFKQVNLVSNAVRSGDIDIDDPESRNKVMQFFEHAVCAAVRFWREEETDALVRQQQRLLGTQQLAPREYDQLIFQRVTSLDVRGAHSLLQEMHNAGLKPSQEAIHRIVLGLLHQRIGSLNDESFAEVNTREESEDLEEADEKRIEEEFLKEEPEAALDSELSSLLNMSDRDAIEQELGLRGALKLDGDDGKHRTDSAAVMRTLLLGSDAPVTIEDLIDFLQDWYNLYGVEPLGKTVVPLLARLLDANNSPELRRLLQILNSMEGGLTPATQLWLEHRLEHSGKTLDDFRLKNKLKM